MRGGKAVHLSLDEIISAESPEHTRHDVVPTDTPGAPAIDPAARQDLLLDLEHVLAALTPRQQLLCTLLAQDGIPMEEVRQAIGLSRSSLYEEIQRVRAVFADYGLENYLRL